MKKILVLLGMLGLIFSLRDPFLAVAGTFEPLRNKVVAENEQQKERRIVEREKRLLLRILDDLKTLIAVVEQETAELQREKDSIALLESPVRGNDIDDFINLYYAYSDWLKEKQAEFESDLALVSSSRSPIQENWSKRMAEMSVKFKRFDKELEKKAGHFDSEEKRLANIIDRRRLLQDTTANMEERLARIEKKQTERSVTKEREEGDANQLRNRIRIVQSELLSLPLIDEDILKHYKNLSERALGEGDWLLAKSNEYAAIRDITAIITGAESSPSKTAVEAAQVRVRQMYEREINRMQRRIDTIERKRSQVSPAGSLREVERSADLNRFYTDQKMRIQDYINRLRIQFDSWLAELSELL
ncbi:MAG TPA: hypothetical protein VGJ93_01370 [Desulfuromonadaceae bacterium]|jgi:hypothetical protein